jgi:serine/threonine-protein kinase
MGEGDRRVSDQPAGPGDALPLDSQLRLDRVCRDFEAAWRGGRLPEIEAFLAELSPTERPAFVLELVLLDLEYRRVRRHPCRVEEYLARFPELDRAWLLDQWASETVTFDADSPEKSGDGNAANSPPLPATGIPSRPNAPPGMLAGEYELLEPIGRGGMGIVYKARQPRLNRLVAVKMILAGEHASEAALKRFRTEAEAAARLQHEGVVQVYDAGDDSGRPYFVMEYVDGGSLRDQLDGTPWPDHRAAQFTLRLAEIIQAAHDMRIVHRDLKPANILLAPRDQVKITDFGLAKLMDAGGTLTQSGDVMGTPSYMAPEQARGSREVLPTIDVYAIGAILYELLTGRPPFRGAMTTDTLLQVINDKPAPPRLLNSRVSGDLETICLKCLEKKPAERYPSAENLAEDLRRYLNNRPILARPPGWLDAVARSLGRRQWVARTIWGQLSLAMGVVGLTFQLAAQWMASTRQPKEVWWLSVSFLWLVVGYILVRFLRPRRHELTPAEHHLMSWFGLYLTGTVVLWVALGTPTDEHLLTTYYPAVAVLTGMGYFVQGSLYWGRFYLLGMAFFALAIVMRLAPDWAPLATGVLYGAGQGVVGWYLLRKKEEG